MSKCILSETPPRDTKDLKLFIELNIACYPYFVHTENNEHHHDEIKHCDYVVNQLDTIRIHLKRIEIEKYPKKASRQVYFAHSGMQIDFTMDGVTFDEQPGKKMWLLKSEKLKRYR